MGYSSVWIGYLGDDFLPVIHRQEKTFIVHSVWTFLYGNAVSCANGPGCNLDELIHVESNVAPFQLILLVHNESTASKREEVFERIPIYRLQL